MWATIFGRGIVETLDNFGTQGAYPTHPELLDWLAVEFMESGWRMKHIYRLIVTSATYRQSSQATPEMLAPPRAAGVVCALARRVALQHTQRLRVHSLASTLSSKVYAETRMVSLINSTCF